ncbi:hypothetical protein P692DRAFT_20661612, partial [Suillus brevipes Sb2]
THQNTVAYLDTVYQGDCAFVQLSACTITRVNDNLNREAVVNATYCPDFCIQGTGHSLTVGTGSVVCLKVNINSPQGAKEGGNCMIM